MTAARQQRKSRRALAALLALALGSGILTPSALPAASDDRTVVNPQSGLAVSGFDPVAYFSEGKPEFGRPDVELTLGGVVWRFRNEGNRAAFSEHPDVYMPRFGGYDPVAIARGTSVPGHPLFWAVTDGRLYLFYNAQARDAFAAEPFRVIDAAERKWPEVAHAVGR